MKRSKGYDIEKYDTSVLSGKTIRSDCGGQGFGGVDEQPSGVSREGEGCVVGGDAGKVG